MDNAYVKMLADAADNLNNASVYISSIDASSAFWCQQALLRVEFLLKAEINDQALPEPPEDDEDEAAENAEDDEDDNYTENKPR